MAMQAQTDQVRWVPIEEIIEEETAEECSDGAVLLSVLSDGRYRLLSGRDKLTRYRAAGLSCVDAVICPSDRLEERISRLLDRQARGRLHFLEEAEAYQTLISGDGLTAEELARRTGRSAATIRRKVRLLSLGEKVLPLVRENGISERTADVLLRIPGQQGRLRILEKVVAEGLDFKATEALVEGVLRRMPVPVQGGRRLQPMMRDYRLYLNAIRSIVEQMQEAGVETGLQVTVGRRVADVRITMPLFTGRR
jgi:ParB family chromosome partitioning protein